MIKLVFLIFIILPISNLYSQDKSIIALMYHRFDDNRYPSTSISKENFLNQINYLKSEQFNFLPLSDLVSFFQGDSNLPDKSIFITIDDGYKSFFENGFPILKKENIPFTVFISTKFVSKNNKTDFMDWNMIKELKKNKGEIFNHTKTHKKLVDLEIDEVKREILDAERKLESELGKTTKIISYPYGESDKRIQELVNKLGYKIAFSQHSSPIHRHENKLNLPRFSINDEFGNIQRFKQIVNSKALLFKSLNVKEINFESGLLKLLIETKKNSLGINCYTNKNAEIKKLIMNETLIDLTLINLEPNNRYRLNCTYFDSDGELYWYGKMINVTDKKIIF
tara:strand:- start:4147 stop:5160 length:1014 start_codon:yes stop_codon:yes gene_type:complete